MARRKEVPFKSESFLIVGDNDPIPFTREVHDEYAPQIIKNVVTAIEDYFRTHPEEIPAFLEENARRCEKIGVDVEELRRTARLYIEQ